MVAGNPQCLSWHWKAVILNGTWHELLDCCNSSAFHAFSLDIIKIQQVIHFNYASSKTVRRERDEFLKVCSARPPGVRIENPSGNQVTWPTTLLLAWMYTKLLVLVFSTITRAQSTGKKLPSRWEAGERQISTYLPQFFRCSRRADTQLSSHLTAM